MKSFAWGMAGLLFCSGIAIGMAAEPEIPTAEFHRRMTTLRGESRATYAVLEGEAVHRRRGGETETHSLFTAILLAPERNLSQVIVDGKEGYYIAQTAGVRRFAAVVTPMPSNPAKTESILGRIGLRPSDLGLNFVYFEPVREEAETRFRTQLCRVLVLRDPETSEAVRLTVSKEHYFPLRAEFFSSSEALEKGEKALRTLEIASFSRKNGLYYVSGMELFGPGWRTRVEFNQADVGLAGEKTKIFR
ncbi:MAG: hypothetical protein PHS41_01775 [Victivallaceae bacterium]|nr:hypothetical protein [Victivallaceae bacterium]